MAHHQVLKAMSTERKMVKVAFFSMTWRQFWIITAPFAVFYMFWTFLADFLPFNKWATVAVFAPVLVGAVLIAYVPLQGRTLDWHIWRYWVRTINPSVLFWRHRPPHLAGGSGDLKNSVQHYLPQEDVNSPLARTKDGTRYLVFKAFRQPSVALAGEEDRDRLWARSKELLDSIDFPVTEILDSREGHVTTYSETLRERLSTTLRADQENLLVFARQHLRNYDRVVKSGNVFERIGYVVLPYNPTADQADAAGPFVAGVELIAGQVRRLLERDHPTPDDARELQEHDEAALSVLTERGRMIVEGYEGMGVSLRLLYGDELTACLRGQATDEPEGDPESPHEQIVRHDRGGYERVPEHKLPAIHAAAEAARERAPLAPATGFLTLPDKIAPDCVEIEDDWIKVGGTYRSYVFVAEWPEKVKFPQLAGLATMRGRIKTVKHMNPLDQDVAADLFGKELARLLAAEEAADTGHVLEKKRRASAAKAAEKGVDELVEERQRFIELSMYVEVQAPTLAELKNLVKKVETKLKGKGARPMLARKEMWEAYVSCLPVADDRLTKRYARKGMLTEPLADLQLFVSHQINHPTGIFLGTDPESGHPITLDTWKLMNPHMIVLGVSGAGKTQTMKRIATALRLQDEFVAIIDPRGNSGYQRVVTAMDGEFVPFGIGSEKRINPFDIKGYLNLELLRALAGDDVEELKPEKIAWARRKAREAALDGKINNLRRLVSIMSRGEGGDGLLSSEEEGEVDDLLRKTYAKKGITDDPDTHDNEPPIFPDFFAVLAEEEEDAREAGLFEREKLVRGIRGRLKLWERGSLRTMFGGQTNVSMDNKFICFHLSSLEGREKAAGYFALQDFLIPRLSDPDEPTNLIDDEQWDILAFPIAAKAHMEQYRTGRARRNRMIGASQDVEEYTSSEHGRAILSIAETKIAMRMKGKPVEELGKYVEISPDQKQNIGRLGKGHGHLVVGENAVPLYVECSEEEMRLFNTDRQKEEDYRRRELARGVTGGAISALKESARREEPEFFGESQERKLSSAGQIRQLLAADSEEANPRAEDFEDLPPEDDPTEENEAAREEPLVPARAEDGEAPLIAVVGPSAGLVAFNLAGLLADQASAEGREVLLVDADGYLSTRLLPGRADPPDEWAANGGVISGPCLMREGTTGLWAMPAPEKDTMPAHPFLHAARHNYDLVVAACGSSTYASEWIGDSDRVVVAGADYLEESVSRAERLRGTDGSLVVPMGEADLPPALADRRAFRLPASTDEAFKQAQTNETFASVTDPAIAGTTAALAKELLLR